MVDLNSHQLHLLYYKPTDEASARHTIWEPVYQPYRTYQSYHKNHINIEKIREAYRGKMQKKILKNRFMKYLTANVRKRHSIHSVFSSQNSD